ncbi:MAG: hypothetical protein H7070_12300 [Saprospiraceae bacterium]|nr:hypothetical protein [Pyrinomonadaceae bacterium]
MLSVLLAASAFGQEQACNTRNVFPWLEQTFGTWDKVRKDSLKIPSADRPWLIFFDESCVIHVDPDSSFSAGSFKKQVIGGESFNISVIKHDGKITMPNREEIPAGLITFASTYAGGKKSFLAAALPSIWRNDVNLKAEKNLDTLVRSVVVHELTHTYHRNFHARLDILEKQLPEVKNFNDDVVQNTFGANAYFRKLYESEHALLYQAIAETRTKEKRNLAKKALEIIRERRTKFYSGPNKVYSEIEDIFLTMEGAANWAAFQSAMIEGVSVADATKLIRRSGKYWSQDEGFALFLVIDSLLPDWQKRAFGTSNASAVELLADAVK